MAALELEWETPGAESESDWLGFRRCNRSVSRAGSVVFEQTEDQDTRWG
jgi:hypothetical protein